MKRTAFWIDDDAMDLAIRATIAVSNQLKRMALDAKTKKQKFALRRRAAEFQRAHKRLLRSFEENRSS